MTKLNIAVLYGGKSPEHEVSVISAVQAMINLAQQRYQEKSKLTFSFSSNILANMGETFKGGKMKS